MRRFHLVDLYSQMPYLPAEMRDWPREHVLAWMGLWGDVWQLGLNGTPNYQRLAAGDVVSAQSDTFFFRSWIGCDLVFTYPGPGILYKPGYLPQGWSSYDQPAGEGDEKLE
jgi:hypothetical protein